MTNLRRIEDALAGLTDIELRALIVASNEVPQIAPWLLAWLEGACDWDLNRRAGQEYELQPPEAAIDPSEDKVSIEAPMPCVRHSQAETSRACSNSSMLSPIR